MADVLHSGDAFVVTPPIVQSTLLIFSKRAIEQAVNEKLVAVSPVSTKLSSTKLIK